MVDIKKLAPTIAFTAGGVVVFILLIISLVIPWYSIESKSTGCEAKMVQSWKTETTTTKGNCSALDYGSREWQGACPTEFCKNKAAVFNITQGLIAYACAATIVAVILYLAGYFGPGQAYQIHKSGGIVFCYGVCCLLPILLGLFLFGIGLTAAVHQDQVDYVAKTVPGQNSATTDTVDCRLAVSCPEFSGEATVENPCSLAPFGCLADPDTNRSVTYKWGPEGGFIVAIIAAIIIAIMMPLMVFFGLRKKKNRGDDSSSSDDPDSAMLKAVNE